jgi:mono/diheme cytochrome c family protein
MTLERGMKHGKRENAGRQMRRYLIISTSVLFTVFAAVGLTRFALAVENTGNMAPQPVLSQPAAGMGGVTIPEPATTPSDPAQAALIARGRYLTVAGDCLPCHTVSGEPAFSGGYPVDTPFGTVFSPNITSSKADGIGNWTDAQFYNALHNGISPGSSLLVFPKYLYPVMPFTTYSKMTYPDVMAVKAYLESLPPVDHPNRPSTMSFPFTVRAGLLGWRILFFHPQPVQYQADWTASQRNGAYLVEALAHCSECHTPRNLLMALETSRYLGGGQIVAQSWYAPNISSSKQYGIGSWDDASLAQYLGGDGAIPRGAPFGPMKEVVEDSLSRLPASDVQDIVAYLRTTPAQDTPPPPGVSTSSPADGAVVYAQNCARCHGVSGQGVTNNFPNLAGDQAIIDGKPSDAISMVAGGFRPWHPNQSAMPSFETTLTPQQIAAVTNYIRTAWGNNGVADATADEVGSLEELTEQEIGLDAGSMTALLTEAGTTKATQDIAGKFDFEANRTNCQIDVTLNGATPADAIHLGGSCVQDGFALQGDVTAGGKTAPVKLALSDINNGDAVTGVLLDGTLPDGRQLHAKINFVTPND